MKICLKCNLSKQLTDFYFRKDLNTYRNECKDCIKAAKALRESKPGVKELRAIKEKERRIKYKEKINTTLWKQRNTEEAKARIKLQTSLYHQKNPGARATHNTNSRLKRQNAMVNNKCSKEELTYWYSTTEQICTYCGATSIKLTLDHIVPLSKGGTHTTDNFALACSKCNCSKGSTPLIIWMAKLTNRSKG